MSFQSGLSKTLVASIFHFSQRPFDCTDEEKSQLDKFDPNTGNNRFQKEALNRRRVPDLKESFNDIGLSLESDFF